MDAEKDLYNDFFSVLNCYQIDASEVQGGQTYIDSHEAEMLATRLATIVARSKVIQAAKQDEAAEIHELGFQILMKKGAAAVVVGGTELDELLTKIEQRHGKDIILHVAGNHNKPKEAA